MKKSHKITLLTIGILIILAVIALQLKRAYRLGQDNAVREGETNQRVK